MQITKEFPTITKTSTSVHTGFLFGSYMGSSVNNLRVIVDVRQVLYQIPYISSFPMHSNTKCNEMRLKGEYVFKGRESIRYNYRICPVCFPKRFIYLTKTSLQTSWWKVSGRVPVFHRDVNFGKPHFVRKATVIVLKDDKTT